MRKEPNPEIISNESDKTIPNELSDKFETQNHSDSLFSSTDFNFENSNIAQSNANLDQTSSVGFIIIDVFLTAVSILKRGLSFVKMQIVNPSSESFEVVSSSQSENQLQNKNEFKTVIAADFKTNSDVAHHKTKIGRCISHILESIKLFLSSKVRLKERLIIILHNFIPDFSCNIDDRQFDEEETVEEFIDFFGPHRGGNKFLNKYSIKDVNNYIRNSPISDILENKLGYKDWYIEFDLSDSFVHYAYLRSHSIPENDRYIGFLIIQNSQYHLKLPKSSTIIPNAINFENDETDQKKPKKSSSKFVQKRFPQNADMLNIRWFSLQNPRGKFTSARPRLPGQKYPGTGLAKPCFSIITKLAFKNNRDGIINVPENFHNAYLYEHFVFLNPDDQGVFERLKEDLVNDINKRGIGAVSWAIYLGFLRDKDNTPKRFLPHEQIFPLSIRMFRYFKSHGFKNRVARAKKNSGPFHIVWEEAEKIRLSPVVELPNENDIIKFTT